MSKEETGLTTLNQLDKQDTENVVGSPISTRNIGGVESIKQRIVDGKKYSFYEDGSLQIDDEKNGIIHYISKEGLKRREERKLAKGVIENDQLLTQLKNLGSGNSGQVSELSENVAVKTIKHKEYEYKEIDEPYFDFRIKRSTLNTLHLNDIFKRLGLKSPEFYGFSIVKSAENLQIQEFQFMEKIKRPSVFDVELYVLFDNEVGVKYKEFIDEICNEGFGGDKKKLWKHLSDQQYKFRGELESKVNGIGDINRTMHYFVTGYDKETGLFEFLLIDPVSTELVIGTLEDVNSSAIAQDSIHDKGRREIAIRNQTKHLLL